MWRAGCAALAVLHVAAMGCGGESSGPVDAGALPDAELQPVEIPWLDAREPPVAPPVLTPCPTGWREVPSATAGGVVTCDPYPEGGAEECGDGEAHFPGETGCAPVGAACPAGEWPEGLPSSGVAYVQATAPTGGDGSIDRPFATIGGALRVATVGSTVAVAKGTYAAALYPTAGVHIVGACAAETHISPRSLVTDSAAVVVQRAGVAHLANLSIVGSPRAGLAVVYGAEVELVGVEIVSATGVGIVIIEGSRATARGLIVRDTRPETSGSFGDAIRVQDGGALDVERAVVVRGRSGAVLGIGADVQVALRDFAVRDIDNEMATGMLGNGLRMEDGAIAVATRAIFERTSGVAVLANGAGASIELEDAVVRETRGHVVDGTGGSGIGAADGGVVRATRTLVVANRDNGVFAASPDTVLELDDVVVRDTEGTAGDGSAGYGLGCGLGASVRVSRGLFERNRAVGITANGGTLRLEDVAVRDTRSLTSDLGYGRGLDLEGGSIAEVYRAVFACNRDVGIYIAGAGTTATFEDVAVLDTDSAEMDGSGGTGIHLQEGGTLTARRLLVDGARVGGVVSLDTGTAVSLEEAVVRNIATPRCTSPTCEVQIAIGIGAYQGSASARRFVVDGVATCGVHVAVAGALDLRDGRVRRSEIGACVQIAGYDVARLSDGVSFSEVTSTLQSTMLPVPSALSPL